MGSIRRKIHENVHVFVLNIKAQNMHVNFPTMLRVYWMQVFTLLRNRANYTLHLVNYLFTWGLGALILFCTAGFLLALGLGFSCALVPATPESRCGVEVSAGGAMAINQAHQNHSILP